MKDAGADILSEFLKSRQPTYTHQHSGSTVPVTVLDGVMELEALDAGVPTDDGLVVAVELLVAVELVLALALRVPLLVADDVAVWLPVACASQRLGDHVRVCMQVLTYMYSNHH